MASSPFYRGGNGLKSEVTSLLKVSHLLSGKQRWGAKVCADLSAWLTSIFPHYPLGNKERGVADEILTENVSRELEKTQEPQ